MGKYYVKKHFKFDAAHKLERHKGKCKNLHGHTWKGWVSVWAEKLDGNHMVMDFAELKGTIDSVIDKFDHKYLNDVIDCDQTTSEIMAEIIYHEIKHKLERPKQRIFIRSVCIIETDGSEAIYHE